MIFIDLTSGPVPKRGDLIQTNVGKRKERTWFILRAKRSLSAKHPHQWKLWIVRWWQIDADLRLRLFRSAERNGGQRTIEFHRYPQQKNRRTFEEWMSR